MDLLDWYRGRLSSRRLAVLVKHLPPDSALAYERHGEAATWGVTEHLLATAVDQLAEANWMFATVNRDEDSEPLEFPAPLRRPTSGGTDPDPDSSDAAAGPGPGPESGPGIPSPQEMVRFFS